MSREAWLHRGWVREQQAGLLLQGLQPVRVLLQDLQPAGQLLQNLQPVRRLLQDLQPVKLLLQEREPKLNQKAQSLRHRTRQNPLLEQRNRA